MSYAEHEKSVEEGQTAETFFTEVAEALDYTVKAATMQQNKSKHIDFFLTSASGTTKSFDVKGMKRQNRRGKTDDSIHWVEFMNVVGLVGWLLGKADYIALEISDAFILVQREHLLDFSYKKCSYDQSIDPVYSPFKGKLTYTPYRRKGKKDSAMMIKMEDLYDEVPHFIWTKSPASSRRIAVT